MINYQHLSKILTSFQDYGAAAENDDQEWLASKGITLLNYYGVGHTSQPNYVGAASGDNYGMDNGEYHSRVHAPAFPRACLMKPSCF